MRFCCVVIYLLTVSVVDGVVIIKSYMYESKYRRIASNPD